MATLSQCSTFFSLPFHKLFLSKPQHHKLSWNTQEYPPLKHFTICASSIKKSRGRRKVKNNEELCNDIREFVSEVGLPEGHVPSMKELSNHGRVDLANIVRRRGYKLIRELFANSKEKDIDGFNAEKSEKSLVETQDTLGDCEENFTGQDEKVNDLIEDVSLSAEVSNVGSYSPSLTTNPDLNSDEGSYMPIESSANLSLKEKAMYTLKDQDEKVNNVVEDVSSSTDSSITENYSNSLYINQDLNSADHSVIPIKSSSNSSLEENASYSQNWKSNHMASTNAPIMENYSSGSNVDSAFNSNDSNCMSIESSVTPTLEAKVAKFIQNGDLDTIEDNIHGKLKESGDEESKEVIELGDAVEFQSRSLGEEHSEHVHSSRVGAAMTSNVGVGTASASNQVAPPATVTYPLGDDHLAAEGLIGADFDKDLDVETSSRENLAEINQLKFMLHQKELELSRLKEHIEKEKLSLSVLQTKAEREINKAQKLISEKDDELHGAEESISGLEEVQIQYCGDGEIVEVAGSFNGWHHRIKMDPQPSSNIIEAIGSRKSRVWSTGLWLYPGVYEIKFIIDGHWRIDPHRESVTRGNICNNILRVDR